MDIVSLCPIRASSLPWQPRLGVHALTVICKATFDLVPGESRLAAEQEYPYDDENHWNDDPDRSLYSPSDLVPFKLRADVLLVGHAFAPHREPVRSLVARLAASDVDKSIEVFGERFRGEGGALRDGRPFVRMPLSYERAAGGPDTENPVGMRVEAGAVPNLQALGAALARPGDRVAPAGFGPIAARWPVRAKKLGAHAERFHRGAWNEQPLPEDFDASYFNAAPPDQQGDRIAADARIVLENLNAQHPILATSLPGVFPRAFVQRPDEALEELPLVADTLWIDTDRSLCTLVWRGQLQLRRPREEGKVSVLLDAPGKPLSWADVEHACGARAHEIGLPVSASSEDPTGRVDIGSLSAEVLPFLTHTATELPRDGGVAPQWLAPPPPPATQAAAPPPVVAPPPLVPPPALAIPIGAAAPLHEPPGGLLAVSNAAAAPPWSAPRAGVLEAASDDESDAERPPPAEIVELLWFDPAAVERIRDNPPWRAVLEAIAPRPPEIRYDDEAPPPDEPEEVKAQRDVFGVLTEAGPISAGGLDDSISRAIGPMGAFRPPLALVAGELAFPFDELETLKATVAAVSPLAAGDKKIKEIVETVNELLKTPWLEGSSGVAEGLTNRVKEAFGQAARLLPAGYLEAHTERRLLEKRHYQRRTVLGRTWIRGLVTMGGGAVSAPAVPVYLPDELATKLPMFQRLEARMVAEVHLQQDQYESHPHALRVVALARVAPGKGRR